MSFEIVDKILYLTHDKWSDRTIVKYREEFREFLIIFLKQNPKIEEELEMMLEYAQNGDALLTYVGVVNILKKADPQTHRKVITRQFAKNAKKKNNKMLFE